MKSTYMAKTEEVPRKWWIIDANGQTLGRLATQVATLLRGKHKPQYTPHIDTGDFVVIVNAGKVTMSGKKMEQKEYFRHSGYFGSLKSTSAEEMVSENPVKMIHLAVKGMLPTNKLSRHLLTKLKVFEGPEHEHAAQKPEAYKLDS
jgi:large subunit ribosomal protein L13